VSTFHDQFLFEPRSSWTYHGVTYAAGSLIAVSIDDWFAHGQSIAPSSATFPVTLLFSPQDLKASMLDFTEAQSLVIISVLEHVRRSRMKHLNE
jgi:hypothetical protein